MRSEDIFAMGLGLLPPWVVKSVSFEETRDGARKYSIYTSISIAMPVLPMKKGNCLRL